jgi:hypothetical protein
VTRYLVLDSDPSDDGVLGSLARALGPLGFEYRFRRGEGEQIIQDVWEGENTDAVVTLVSDHHTPSQYVMVEGRSDESEDRVASELAGGLPVVPLQTLQERAADGEDASDLVRLAQAVEPDEVQDRSARIVAEALDHEEPLFRYRAAEAAGLMRRPEFHERLEQLAGDDPDDSVRAMAEAAARACVP